MTIDLTADEEDFRSRSFPRTTPTNTRPSYQHIQSILEDDDDEDDDDEMEYLKDGPGSGDEFMDVDADSVDGDDREPVPELESEPEAELEPVLEAEAEPDQVSELEAEVMHDDEDGNKEPDMDAVRRMEKELGFASESEIEADTVQNSGEPVSVLRKRARNTTATMAGNLSEDRVVDSHPVNDYSVPVNIASSPFGAAQSDNDENNVPLLSNDDIDLDGGGVDLTDSQYELMSRYRRLENEALCEKIKILEKIIDEGLSRARFEDNLTQLESRIQSYRDKINDIADSNTNGEAEDFLERSPPQNYDKYDVVCVDSEDVMPDNDPPMQVNEFSEPFTDDHDDELLNDFLRNRDAAQLTTPTKNDRNAPIEISESSPLQHIHSSPQGLVGPQVDSQVQSIYATRNYPWDSEVTYALKQVFKLPSFRQNQKEAINATLDGKDVLVLMPTGGGKSLCYQLPALVKGGKTHGITVVISPLISLMQDQVEQLKSKGIKAEVINSKCTGPEKTARFNMMMNDGLDLLYLSPEMLSASTRMQRSLDRLKNEKKIARFVIDEAHCVSSWGHDFRTDYKELENLKLQYPDVPIMALTATATRPVQLDITRCLRDDPIFLKQTFNRPNLHYEIREKGSQDKAITQIKDLVTKDFGGKTGIIYCHSRKSCEDTCHKLKREGVRVEFYHGGMEPSQRERVQEFWQKGYVTTICATIAFGMGIDKPDVRYVIHLTLPQTMEGYYQETGRAGRDGRPSKCILFYSYKDATMMKRLISTDSEMTRDHKTKMLELFRKIVLYCEEVGTCRRRQILEYFEENFDPSLCNKTCDNCKSNVSQNWAKKDVTDYAKAIIEMMGEIQNSTVPLGHCIDVFRGSKKKSVIESGHDRIKSHGKGKDLDPTTADRIFHGLLAEGYLQEYQKYSGRFAQSYLKRTEDSKKVLQGQSKVIMRFPDVTTKNKRKSTTSNKRNNNSNNADDEDMFNDDAHDSGEEMNTSEFFGTESTTSRPAANSSTRGKSRNTTNTRKRKTNSNRGNYQKKRATTANNSKSKKAAAPSGRFDAMPI
jgi:RecQ family ATP-dependent DNA helicase